MYTYYILPIIIIIIVIIIIEKYSGFFKHKITEIERLLLDIKHDKLPTSILPTQSLKLNNISNTLRYIGPTPSYIQTTLQELIDSEYKGHIILHFPNNIDWLKDYPTKLIKDHLTNKYYVPSGTFSMILEHISFEFDDTNIVIFVDRNFQELNNKY